MKEPSERAAPGDFRQTQDPSYLLKYFRGLTGDNVGMTYIEGLGGGSGFYEMISLRAPSPAFELRDDHGRRLWPATLTRAALDPYYEIAERMLNVHQIPVEQVPKSGLVLSRMMKNLGYSCDRAAYAVRGCIGSGFCVSGCIYGAKQSLHLSYIPRAKEAGAVFRTGVEALRIRALQPGPSARHANLGELPARYEIVCREVETERAVRYRTRLLILAGGTVGTAKLLLASRGSLSGLSDAVGRRIAFNGGVKTAGLLGSEWTGTAGILPYRRRGIAIALIAAAAGASAACGQIARARAPVAETTLTVAVQNLYVGAELRQLLTAQSPEQIPALVAREYRTIRMSRYPERAAAMAEGLSAHRPHLIGLQEVSLFRRQSPGDTPAGNPRKAREVTLDFLGILLEELERRGTDYREVARYRGMDVEVPVQLPEGSVDDMRLTDSGVILARAVERALTRRRPPSRMLITTPRGRLQIRLIRWLPDRIVDRLILSRF
ncbi:MAG: GMC family oxidoreductase N-terminal domain-containing protein [Gemmatimonadota bacterium]